MIKLNKTITAIAIAGAISGFSNSVSAQTLLEVGEMKVPLILVNYSDTETTATASQIENKLFNGEFDVNDYFNEVSYDKFNVTGKAYGWFTMPKTHDYYGENDPDNADWDKHYAELAEDAIAASDATVDYSDYDADGDCIVDSVAVVYQGYDENDPLGKDSNIWPINMSLSWENANGTTQDRCASDSSRFVEVERITLIPELRSDNPDGLSPIGLLTHELVHSGFGNRLGDDWFPDLYGANGSKGISLWGLMGLGNHLGSIPYRNADGELNPDYVTDDYTRPAHMTAFTKVLMNWVTPIELEAGDSINNAQFRAASTSNPTIYKVANPNDPKEYYLIENRYQDANSFDAGIDASGLAVWHIDEGSWNDGTKWGCSFPDDPFVAASSGTCDQYTHSVIALTQADGLWEMEDGSSSDYQDLFSNSKAGISTSTYPSSRFYDFSESGLSITNISAPGATMTADIKVSFPDTSQPTYCEAEKPYSKGNGTSTLSITNAGSDETVGFYWLNEDGERYPDFALRAPYAWITPDGTGYSADWTNGDKVVFVDQSDNCLTVADVTSGGTDVEVKADGGYANNVKIFDLGDTNVPCEDTGTCPVDGYAEPAANNTNWEHIDNVTISGVNNASGDNNGYGDFSGNSVIEISQNDEISLSASGNSAENWIVWVDLNNDFEFSSNEIVYQSATKANDVTGTLSNLTSSTGITTRMRIAMSYGTPNATGGFEGEIEDYTVTVTDGGSSCAPNCGGTDYQEPASNNTNWEHIDNVTISGITNASGDDNGYGDYSNNSAISIAQGGSISLSASGNSAENWIVWVDLNSDFEFASNEIVYQSTTKANDVSGTLSNLNSANGLTTRMRIAMSYGTPTSTGGFEGEIEDYTVTIGDATGCTNNCSSLPSTDIYDVNVASGSYEHFSVEVPAGASTITVNLDKNGGSAMLMLNKGSQASAQTYDARDTGGTRVSINDPAQDTWYIAIRGRTNGVENGTLTITVE